MAFVALLEALCSRKTGQRGKLMPDEEDCSKYLAPTSL
jgi:hypothetical protein